MPYWCDARTQSEVVLTINPHRRCGSEELNKDKSRLPNATSNLNLIDSNSSRELVFANTKMSEGKAVAERIQEDLIDYVVIKSEKVILLLILFLKFHFRFMRGSYKR